MHELNRHRAFANRRGDTFDRAGAHIPGREHARPARLEKLEARRSEPTEPRKSLLPSWLIDEFQKQGFRMPAATPAPVRLSRKS